MINMKNLLLKKAFIKIITIFYDIYSYIILIFNKILIFEIIHSKI